MSTKDQTNLKKKKKKKKWEEKQPNEYFKWQIGDIAYEKTKSWLPKGNLKRKTEPLLIATLNNSIRTNDIKAKIDTIEQNSDCRLCGDKDETVNDVTSEFRKLVQKEYKSRHDIVENVIHW